MTCVLRFILLTSLGFAPLRAATRDSVDYVVSTEILDSGGEIAISQSYRNTPSLGGGADLAVTAPDTSMQPGFIAQLAATTGLALTATGLSVEETGTLQIAAWETLADATRAALAPAVVVWSTASGPLTINAAGLATATPVYQDTAATAAAAYAGFSNTLPLIVLNSASDNYGSYANDGLRDDWQIQYFGMANPNAGPALDPDNDGLDNAFECAAALNPTNAASAFTLAIQSVPNQATQRKLVFGPWNATANYAVEVSSDMSHWFPLTSFTTVDSGTQRTVTDLAATQAKKFYRVAVTSTVQSFTYANDGLPDAWQALYFGVANPNAAPDRDPDQDGFNNLFEYRASLIPTDSSSRFNLTIQPVSGQPSRRQIIFSPRYDTATYTVEASTDLNHWSPLTSFTTVDVGTQRTVTDLAATSPNTYYRVILTPP